MIEEGSVVGGYQVLERIGQGASAIVHKGRHIELDRLVVMKFLPLLGQPLARTRFTREAKALRRLDHPNVLQVLDTGEAEGTPYMVFDFIPGGSLAQKMAAWPLTAADALAILDGIAKGLDYAHGRGIIHRDVKPANILLTASGTPVIADFGLVRILEQPSATATGMFAGTPAYMAPEQAEGGAIGAASDQYSLAAMAYEMITGQVPFPGDTVSEVLTALLTRPPARPSEVLDGLSTDVDDALLRGLSKRPDERWPNCQALADNLLRAMVASLSTRPGATLAPRSVAIHPSAAATVVQGVAPDPVAPAAAPLTTPRSNRVDPRLAGLDFGPSEPNLTIVVPYGKARPRRTWRRRLILVTAAAVILVGGVAAGEAWSAGAFSGLGAHAGAIAAGAIASL